MRDFWPVVLTVSGLATSGQFALAIRRHFISEKMPPATKFLVALSYCAIFVYVFALWTGTAPAWQRVTGLCLQIVAASLFNWTKITTLGNQFTLAFDTDKPEFVMKMGPYRFVRHPFYISYITFWVGSSLGGNSPVLWLICLVLIVIYVVAALLEERKFKNSPLADDYQTYSTKTGFFFPKFAVLSREDRPEDRPFL